MANTTATQLESKVNSWLDAHQNRLQLDFTANSISFRHHSGTLFTSEHDQVHSTLGFKSEDLSAHDSLEKFRSNFNFITLDRLPVPDLHDIPAKWEIYPQTPISSFSEGVTLEDYDPKTQILKIHVRTNFFAIYGRLPPEHPIGCGRAPEGTYFQVRRDIQGDIRFNAKLIF